MSTKIYSGFHVPSLSNASLEEVSLYFNKMMEQLRKIGTVMYKERFLGSLYHEADMATYRNRVADIDNTIYQYERGDKRGNDRFSFLQHYAGDITIYSFEGEVYFTHYFDDHIWKVFEKKHKPKYEHFGYWDNADGPETLSEEAWENRERVWGEILKKYDTPCQVGLSISAYGKYQPAPVPDWDESIKKQPTKKQRVESILETTLIDLKHEEFLLKYLEENNMTREQYNEQKSMGAYMDIYYKIRKAITEEDKQTQRNYLNILLPDKYTEDSLKDRYGWNK
jgi:hypothetical protein